MQSDLNAFMLRDSPKINESALEYFYRLKRVKAFVAANYEQNIVLGDAAAAAGRDRKYFCRYLKEKVGLHFRQWLTLVRLQAAIRMLDQEDYSILEVSSRVGFADVRTFQRAFRLQTNVTPRDFKRSIVNQKCAREVA